MAKYVIDIPDDMVKFMNNQFEVLIEPVLKAGECRHYKVRLDKKDITPYIRSDKQKIHMGDEVIINGEIKAIYMECDYDDDKYSDVLAEDGIIHQYNTSKMERTGRHFDEIETMVMAMRGEA